jgi:2,3-bisphosphoglycerate-independent phosphoglycerate mutase
VIYDNFYTDRYTVKTDDGGYGLADVAATAANLLGYEAPEIWCPSLIEVK